MAIDTVKIESPTITEELAHALERQSVLRQGIDNSTGEVMYALTSGSLDGSHDSRISFRVMRERSVHDVVQVGPGKVMRKGAPRKEASKPYLIVEGSIHKMMLGHNIYGGPVDFQASIAYFVGELENRLDVILPEPSRWLVRRVDWAEVFRLPYAAIQEFFESAHTVHFPRRGKSAQKYGSNALYFPGSFTTTKLYHKGPEFHQHDFTRIRSYLRIQCDRVGMKFKETERFVARKLIALQRLANNRLRAEVEIHAEKLRFDFGELPRVEQVTDDYLAGVYEHDMQRLLKEGKSGMDTVRDTRSVLRRLVDMYGESNANRYYGFWSSMTTLGEEVVKQNYLPDRKATYYRYRKALLDVGVSWVGTDVHVVANDSALPRDFVPLRADVRRCTLPARNRSFYEVPLQLAA